MGTMGFLESQLRHDRVGNASGTRQQTSSPFQIKQSITRDKIERKRSVIGVLNGSFEHKKSSTTGRRLQIYRSVRMPAEARL